MIRKAFIEIADQFLTERQNLFSLKLTSDELVDGLIAIWDCEGDECDDGWNPRLSNWMKDQYGPDQFRAQSMCESFEQWIKESLD